MQKLHLDGSHVSLQRFVELADGPVSITLAPAIRERLVRAREIVARYAASDQPVYGLNTGLGGNLQHRIEPKDIPAFQAQLLLARSAGVGPNLPEWISRAAWLSRIIGAARGASGLSLATFDLCWRWRSADFPPPFRPTARSGPAISYWRPRWVPA